MPTRPFLFGMDMRTRSRYIRSGRFRPPARAYAQLARQRLRKFRTGSILAVAATALLLVIMTGGDDGAGGAAKALAQTPPDPLTGVEEATDTVRDLGRAFYAVLPKVLVALVILGLAAGLSKAFRWVFKRTLRNWSRADATGAVLTVVVWAISLSAALSVVAGDARAMVGLVGLIGLALSWALQAPIESFTGWMLNAFKAYYQVGDRVGVGEVFGDVYRIDLLTTTVWEAGGPDNPVKGAQPTGSLVTFPNSEVLRSNIINYTKLFPYVWDEIVLSVGDGTDLAYAARTCKQVAQNVVNEEMGEPIRRYNRLLSEAGLAFDVPAEPHVFVTLGESWHTLTIRYLVHARRRRVRSSEMSLAIAAEMAKPAHEGLIMPHLTARVELDRPQT
jgi:small conductance mechanosensitive channel